MTPLLQNILDQPSTLISVLQTLTAKQPEALLSAAELLRTCKGRVIVTGMGASYFGSLSAACALQQAGIALLCMESAELLHFGAELPRPGDVAILVSRSGGSVEVVSLLPRLRELGIAVIGVSNDSESELAKGSSISLLLHSAPDQMVAIQTYASTVLLLQLLAELVAGARLSDLQTQGERALESLAEVVAHCERQRTEWRSWLQEAAPVYLLGRGSAMGSVQEGALLLHETAKAPAVAMSSGQFRHGPVEVVTPAFRGIVIASRSSTYRLEVALANDVTAMGAPVMWIGPEPAAGEPALTPTVQRMFPWPGGQPDWVAPLFEVVPLQFAAYELALLRGLTPGDFRYTPQVTRSEEGFASVTQVG